MSTLKAATESANRTCANYELGDLRAWQESEDPSPNKTLIQINTALREHPVEKVGAKLRGYMSAMKKIV